MEYLNEEGLAALWDDTKEYVEKYHDEHSGGQDSDGTDAGPIVELTAKGHAEQFTTLGKNLLPNNGTTKTTNGVTFTVNADKSVTVNGTASEVAYFYFLNSGGTTLSVGAGTYTFSGAAAGASGAGYCILARVVNGNEWHEITTNTTLTLSSDTSLDNLSIRVRKGTVCNNLTFYPQLELGSTATSYEPYTGGAPSPSPDYPQEIQVVRGRNLLPPLEVGYTQGLTVTKLSDGGIHIQGKPVASGDVLLYDSATNPIVLNDTGVLSIGRTAATGYTVGFGTQDNRYSNIVRADANSVVVPAGQYTSLAIYVNSTNTYDIVLHFQLEYGSVAHGYVPYGDYVGLEARSKKNMLEVNDVVVHDYNYTQMLREPIALNGKYVLSASVTSNDTNAQTCLALLHYTNGGTSSSLQFNRGSRYSIVLNINEDVTLDGIIFYSSNTYSNGAGDTAIWSDIQLEVGDVMTDFEKGLSTTPIPLPSRGWAAGLPDGTADTLTLDGAGKVSWERACEEVVMDGSSDENISAYGKYPDDGAVAGFTFKSIVSPIRGTSTVSGYCSVYPNPTSGGAAVDTCRINATYQAIYLYGIQRRSGATTVADFKSWLSTHPVTVLYPLATPVTESRGYVDLPSIPEGATLSIPELDALGVRYAIDGAASTLMNQLRDRFSEPIAELQSDVAEIATDAATTRAGLSEVTANELYDAQVANDVYAGRSIQTILGTSDFDSTVTALHNRVIAANFDGLRIGDYIDVAVTGYGTIRYRIAAFDHYYNCGDTAMPHHIVFVPNAPIVMPSSSSYTVNSSNIMWNTTADNNGTESENNPYLASNLHAWEIGEYLPALPSTLQGYLKDFRDLVEVRYNASSKLTDSTSWKWAGLGKVWSPSEMEVYGTCVCGTKQWSQGLGSQFPIFRNTRDRIRGGRVAWWLRVTNSGSSSDVCNVYNSGITSGHSATYTYIRPLPCFLFG